MAGRFMLLALFCLSIHLAGAKPIDFSDTLSLADRIHQKAESIRTNGKTTDQLTEEELANLPIGIVKEIGGLEYMIIVDSVRFTPAAAYMNVYASVEMAGSKRLAFGATDIIFQPGGLSASTSTKLQLVSEEKVPFGKKIDMILPANGSNYVEFDCNGFKSVNVKGIFEFSQDILIPADSMAKPTDKVRAYFEGNFMDINNILVSLRMESFRPQKFQDIVVVPGESYLDLSDLANPTSFRAPEGYLNSADNPVFWQGFFLKHAGVILPNKLKGGGDEASMRIDAQDLIIDKKGFSGKVGVSNLFDTKDGNLNGWPLSIDSLGVHIVKNQLMGAAFNGLMVVPPFDKESPLKYSAIAYTDQFGKPSYTFYLETSEDLKSSALMADIVIKEGSSIVVKEVEGKFIPEALLNGSLSVDAGEKLKVQELAFEKLHLSSAKPYIQGGTWSLSGKGDQSAGSFPIAIQGINMYHGDDQLKLSLYVMLNLMNKESKGFSAETSVIVEAALEEETIMDGENTVTVQEWVHKRTHISEATIDYQSKAFGLKGSVVFYENHSQMGNGFRGEIDARFGQDLQVKAVAQFGKVDGFKYWYADAMVKLPAPAGAGFGIYGLGGGAYYHMKSKETQRNSIVEFETVSGSGDTEKVGFSRSGTEYIPDKDSGLGFKASVVVGLVPEPKPFNGVATFEMAFYAGGGIKSIGFLGEGYFMKNLNEPAEKSQMYAFLDVKLDFENDELHGELDTYINVGENVLRGSYANGHAGKAVIHVDKQNWYLHVGNPSQRISVTLFGAAEIGAYFMVGTYIEDFPSVTDVIPGDLVSSISNDLDGFMRDESALSSGGGIAFGASLAINTGRKQFLIFYGQFDAGLGFDVMLRDYGGAYCAGESEPIGINGWYASGQAWLYLQGEIGIQVKLKFIQGEFAIMDVGMAAIVQAKLPNPTVVNGYVVGKYNILGGLVKGDFNFKVSIGDDCEIIGAKELDIDVIAEISPAGSEKVDVFTAPQVAFNVPINEEFEYLDDISGSTKAYKVKLDHFNIKKGSEKVSGEIQFNDNNKVAIFNSHEILPPLSELKTEVKVSWNERINGVWRQMGGNTPEFEEETVNFTTGEAPDYIPESNVQYSYPVTGMRHFYPNEHDKGYMKLKTGQSYLFEDRNDFSFAARFVPVGSLSNKGTPLEYDDGSRTVSYKLPSQLENSRAYNIMYVKKPLNVQFVDENVKQIEETLEASTEATIVIETQDIEGTMLLLEEEVLYESYFATSMYNTVNEKLLSLGSPIDISKYFDYYNVESIGLYSTPVEGFDEIEVNGIPGMEPLVQMEAILDNNDWYKKYIYPLNYQYYPVNSSMRIAWRDEDPFGIPPTRAMYLSQTNYLPALQKEDIYRELERNNREPVILMYELGLVSMRDYYELKNKAANFYEGQSQIPPGALYILKNSFKGMTEGSYDFRFYYKLPGQSTSTTEKAFTIRKKI